MTREDFERTLRVYTRRKPFIPFTVLLTDGRRYVIDHPELTFNGSVAGCISETDGLIDFSFDEVERFDILVAEPQV